MLGLRKSLTVRRKRKNSNSSSLISEGVDDSSSTHAAMDAIRKGFSDPLGTVAGKHPKANESPNVSVSELVPSDDESEHTAIVSQQSSPDHGSTAMVKQNTSTSILHYFTRVTEVAQKSKETICRLPDYNASFVEEMDLESYLRFISDERLMHMPRRGSDWDRVLRAAQFFGLQIWSFGERVERFAPGAQDSAAAALASCQVLLEIGHGQAKALVPTFVALYELAMLLSNIGQARDLEGMPSSVKEDAGHIFCDLVQLAGQVAIYYRRKISSLRSGHSVHMSFDAEFGKQIDHIWRSKDAFCDRIWTISLGSNGSLAGLRHLRQMLEPEVGSSIRNSLYDEVAEQLDRSEDTCNWFRDDLVQFLENDEQFLSVTGPPGSGKTVVAEWCEERLARPLDHKAYAVLKYNFPYDSLEFVTPTACAKSLISQLLDRSVGNVDLYERLNHVFKEQSKHPDSQKLEAALWATLREGLRTSERKHNARFVILTDGCDEIGETKEVLRFHESLKKSVKGLEHTRVITFSRPVSHISDGCKHLVMSRDDLKEDIRNHLRQTIFNSDVFQKIEPTTAELFIDELTTKSKDSFLWAFYVGRLLSRESSAEKLLSHGKAMSEKTSEVLHKVIDHMKLKDHHNLRHLLSFMAVSEQPLEVMQAAELMSIEVSKRILSKAAFDVSKFVSQSCGDVVIIQGGRLHFRNAVVRKFMIEQLGKSLLSHKDAHYQLTLRMLLYARLTLDADQEVQVDELDITVVHTLLGSHHLLRYVMKHWIFHFQQSGCLSTNGDINLSTEFREIFPGSAMFGLLERSCWHRAERFNHETTWHELSLTIRKTCFGEKHLSVLQSLINLGQVYFALSGVEHSAKYLYQAVKLGQVVLTAHSTTLYACTRLFLTCTETIVITKRTETVTYREEMIRYMITICKHSHGHSSDEVISWYEKLAKLYIDIKEEETATVVYRELYEIIVIRFGKKSERAKQMGSFFGTMDIVLKGEAAEKHIGELEEFIFETSEELEITDQMNITLIIRLAQQYISCGKFFLAERLYISLWRRFSIICKGKASANMHIFKIQIAIEYVKFLRHVKRTEEATNILVCLWAEYEHYSCEAETLIIWVREIGTMCKTFGLLTVAVSILTKVWGWFKSKGKTEGEEAERTTLLITEVVEEITETTTTTKTTTTTTTEVTETVTKEIFELHYTRCKKSKVDKAFFSACMALIGLYIQRENWAEAEVVIKRTLEITWKAILSTELKITLCEHSVTECITIARRLAICHLRQGHFEMAEKIHLRIYYACLASLSIESVVLTEAITVLIGFYEEHHRHSQIIEIYVELLARYRKRLGHSHKLTIKTLYLLAAQCEMVGRIDAYEHYLEIVTVLNKGHKHCHHDAIKAALILVRYYHTRKMWAELQHICSAVWETIVHHRGTYVFTEEIIALVYEKYVHVLEFHAKVSFSMLYKLTVEYKEVMTVVCGGTSSSGFILALLALAAVCEKSEEHYHESVTIYEEIIKRTTTVKTTTTTVTETTVKTVKKRLSKMYVTIITSGKKGGSTGTTATTIDRAIQISLEAYGLLKIEFGCWHEKTLLKLKDVIILYQTLKTKEAHLRMVELLQVSVIEIITSVKVTMSLFTAATTLASIYLTAGLSKEAHELLHQIRHIVIFRGTLPYSGVTLKIDHHISKVVFVFIIGFEQGLEGKQGGVYSEIMADIVLESILYEEYHRLIETGARLELTFECGAKLRSFWEEHKRSQFLVILDKKLLHLLMAEYGTHWKGLHEDEIRIFYLSVLAELSIDRSTTKMDFAALACKAGNAKVKALIEAGEFKHALQVARVVFQFASNQKVYHRRHCIQYGYKLAEFLAGIDVPLPSDDAACKASLDTSRHIMVDVLAAFRAAHIDFLSLRFNDLAGLIRLLGAQHNYEELESLLLLVWRSRETMQRSVGWSPNMVLDIGKLLVHAQYANKKVARAIDTAELLYYNLRRGRGRLDAETLDVAKILASLYSIAGRLNNSLGVHEAVLREIASACHHDESGGGYPKRALLVSHASGHLELLRAAHHQLKTWPKPAKEYREIYDRLNSGLKLGLPNFQDWTDAGKDKAPKLGKYTAPRDWKIEEELHLVKTKKSASETSKDDSLDIVKTATQWWRVF